MEHRVARGGEAMRVDRLIRLGARWGLLGGIVASTAPGGDVTSTRLFGQPFNWADPARWSHDPSVSTFPNNGNEGHTFDVIIANNNLVELDQSITIDSMRSRSSRM